MTTLVQQRGETAVLGLGVQNVPVVPQIFDVSQTVPVRESASVHEARLAARGIARRKLQRKENGEL